MQNNRKIHCPTCKKEVEEQRYLPFCSSRCKLVDLGAWASESYKVSRPISADENEDETSDLESE